MSQWIDFDQDQVEATMTFSLLGHPIRISMVWVDRDTSRSLLKLNVHNRSISRKTIDQIKRDITAGKWVFTGDVVRFSRGDSAMMDAQHRLIAVDESDARVPMLIVEGLDPSAAGWIDQNRKRSVPDILRFRGSTIGHVTTCASAAGILMQAEDLTVPATREMVADYVEDHSDELSRVAPWAKGMCDQAPFAHTKTRVNSRALSPGPLTAFVVHMLRQGANAKLLGEFVEGIATGLSRTEEDKETYAALRRRISDVPLFVGGGGAQIAVLLTEGFEVLTKAYNKWADGVTIRVVRSQPKEKRVLIRSYDKLSKVNTRTARPGSFSLTSDTLDG